ncbi:protein of unknown function [Andreprevotia lacus DSM 23236]|uniref:DUF4253 domain-containing protein n=1 Tax=Andreprevotia lacus DSM 23236 TaxID=1121001 RepID=A0A1W1XN97_9NEIS|nr:DUF4253 domain-containing protein [Andreprevotia lacus]SMC25443.1 protein of unknown function [Andreprevotia lacus DSM 23236]
MLNVLTRTFSALLRTAPIQALPELADPLLAQVAPLLQQVAGASVRDFATRDFGRQHYTGAISALVPERRARRLLNLLRPRLPGGLVAFVGTTRSLCQPPAQGVELVVGHGQTQLDVLDIAASNAANFDMDTPQLKAVLARWQQAYGIDLWQAETDTVQLRLLQTPLGLMDFADEVYDFCPDIVNQGGGTVAALARDIAVQGELCLWWD